MLIGREIWDEYFKFTVVRNPYDRMISRYFWSLSNGKKAAERYGIKSFNQYPAVLSGVHQRELEDLHRRATGLLVDDVVRYENLAEDLGRISARHRPRATTSTTT